MSEESGAQEIAEPFLTVKYNKQEKNLSRDEAREYAQKGMNYDKVSKRLNETAQKTNINTREARLRRLAAEKDRRVSTDN